MRKIRRRRRIKISRRRRTKKTKEKKEEEGKEEEEEDEVQLPMDRFDSLAPFRISVLPVSLLRSSFASGRMRGPMLPLIGMECGEALKILGVWISAKLKVTILM